MLSLLRYVFLLCDCPPFNSFFFSLNRNTFSYLPFCFKNLQKTFYFVISDLKRSLCYRILGTLGITYIYLGNKIVSKVYLSLPLCYTFAHCSGGKKEKGSYQFRKLKCLLKHLDCLLSNLEHLPARDWPERHVFIPLSLTV